MLFKALTVAFLAATSLASKGNHAERRQAQETIDYTKVSQQLNDYLSTMTMEPIVNSPKETLGVSVPSDMRQQILTAVPMKVVVNLINPDYRSSVANDFAEGRTPEWFEKLEPEVKTYFQAMATSIKGGDAVYTVTPTPTATGTDDAPQQPQGNSDVTSTSSDGEAARPTAAHQGVVAGAVGVAGVLGLALAL